MEFKTLDIGNWKRKEHFNHYFSDIPCTYSATVNIDISNIIHRGIKLYPSMLYLLCKTVNMFEEFRTCLDKDGTPGVFSSMNPSYTLFNNETKMFSSIWTEYNEDFSVFFKNYLEDVKLYGKKDSLSAKPCPPENLFPVSMIPWMSFSSFNLNLKYGYSYLLPIFTLGKYFNEDDTIKLPLSAQVHHSVCDGYHLSLFINELQNAINCFSPSV